MRRFLIVLAVGGATLAARPLRPSQTPSLPRLDDFPIRESFTKPPTSPDVHSTRLGRRFRTVIRREARNGPNFAGHFTLVRWGCGSACIMYAVIDAATGRVFEQPIQTMVGATFSRESALIIADPPDSARARFKGERPPADCVSCGTPAAYVWRGDHFQPVGPGEHPHLATPRWNE
jgi:hypothetical protein